MPAGSGLVPPPAVWMAAGAPTTSVGPLLSLGVVPVVVGLLAVVTVADLVGAAVPVATIPPEPELGDVAAPGELTGVGLDVPPGAVVVVPAAATGCLVCAGVGVTFFVGVGVGVGSATTSPQPTDGYPAKEQINPLSCVVAIL